MSDDDRSHSDPHVCDGSSGDPDFGGQKMRKKTEKSHDESHDSDDNKGKPKGKMPSAAKTGYKIPKKSGNKQEPKQNRSSDQIDEEDRIFDKLDLMELDDDLLDEDHDDDQFVDEEQANDVNNNESKNDDANSHQFDHKTGSSSRKRKRSESSDSSKSSGSEESDEDEWCDDDDEDDDNRSVKSYAVDSWRFDPLAHSSKRAWKFSSGQQSFCDKYFSKYVGESALKKTVLKKVPCPDHETFKVPKMDTDIVDLLPIPARNPVKAVDMSFRRVQGRLMDTMGPLGKLWVKLEKAAKDDAKVDADKLIQLAEQAILMVGQSNVLLNHNRRLNVLARFLKDPKSAGELLRQNEATLLKNKKELFGPVFYKALHRRAKGHKHNSEIRRELGSKQRQSWSHQPRGSTRGSQGRGSRRPFQRGPSSHNASTRGAQTNRGRSSSRGSYGRSRSTH